MVLKRPKLFLITSLYLLLISCSDTRKKEDSSPKLECLIDVFLEKRPTSNENFVYVSEAQNWTDSTSVISLQYSEIPPETQSEKIAKFNNYTVVYSQSSFNDKIDKAKTISTNLEWKNTNPNDYKKPDNNDRINYSEYEMQIIYDFKNNRIQDVLKSHPVSKEKVYKKTLNCNQI